MKPASLKPLQHPPCVFGFEDVKEYLRALRFFRSRGSERPRLSQQGLARALGYSSHRSVSMVLSGERLPSSAMLAKISDYFGHDLQERRYLQLLVEKQRAVQNGYDLTLILKEMEKLGRSRRKATSRAPLQLDQYFLFSEWHHTVIKQLLALPPVLAAPETEIERRLRSKISRSQISASLNLLQRLGFITKSADGQLILQSYDTETEHDLPRELIRHYHKKMMELACKEIDKQPIDEREYTSLTFRGRYEDIPRIKRFLRRMVDQFEQEFDQGEGADIFQMNLQFFMHTNGRRPEG